MNVLNPFPHVSRFKSRTIRRAAMVLFLPFDIVLAPIRAWYDLAYGFRYWWRQP